MMTTVQTGPLPGTTLPLDARLVAGVGCGSAADADEIVALLEQCLAELGASPAALVGLASHVRKADHPGLVGAARHFGIPLRVLDDGELSGDIASPSTRVMAAIGRPSIAEAVAGAVGPLLLAKRKSPHATCAIALCNDDFNLQAHASRASMAPSTLSTSSAGP
jgi:cobalamin biosynthesis protein CbiG